MTWWQVLLEIVLGLLALILGVNFWALLKSPAGLRKVLADRLELASVVKFFGPDLYEQAAQIKPVLGSYAGNIWGWEKAHSVSLSQPRNIILVVALVLIGGSAALGVKPLMINAALFLVVPALFPLSASAQNNNVNHIRTVAVNLVKWMSEDPEGCAAYCNRDVPSLKTLHELLVSERRQ